MRLRPRAAHVITLGALALWMMAGPPGGATTLGLHHASTSAGGTNSFAGAVFSPGTAPTITRSGPPATATLSWQEVTISSGATVRYTVMRIPRSGPPVEICTGSAAPVVSAGTVTCSDTVAGSRPNDRYTERPYVIRDGQVTWSLAASTPSV